MKIVHVVYGLEYGGIETMLVNIVNEQVKYQKDISILVINRLYNNDLIKTIDKKVNIYYIERPISSKNPYYILKLNYLLRKLKPDILHIHTSSIIRFIIPNIYRKKICLTKHDVFEDNHIGYYTHIYSISDAVKDFIADKYKLESEVIINGINVKYIRSDNKLNHLNCFRIVQVSRLSHEIKGQHILIEAIKQLKDKGLNISADFIGDGPSREFLANLINEYGLEAEIRLLGTKSQQYIFEHLCEYNLFVQPSICEGFGLTVAEAMAAKVPVLVAENPGPLEIIDNGKYGYSFKNGDVDDCVAKIIEIINRGIDTTLIEEAYRCVEEKYSVSLTANRYLEEYNKIISKK